MAQAMTAEMFPAREGGAVAAMSSDGACVVTSDREVIRVAGGRALMSASSVIAGAVLEHAVWLVTRDATGHALHRFHPSGTPVAPPTKLGELGERVTIEVNRSGVRVALIEGERAVLVRERDGDVNVEQLGDRRRDRRVLVGARGVAERSGGALRLRSGTVPPLTVPQDLQGYAIGAAAVVHDGNALLVELVGCDVATALVYDLRYGEVRKRIRLGELRVLAIAERAGLVVLGKRRHVALLDLRAGHCVSERILDAAPTSCAIDAAGTRLVIVDVDGNIIELGRDNAPVAAPEPGSESEAASEPVANHVDEPEPASAPVSEPVCVSLPAALPVPASEPVSGPASATIAPLLALGAPLATSPFSDEDLASYLDDMHAWIDSMCTTAVAIARGDAALIDEATKREHACADACARWNASGAPHVEIARELGLRPLAGTVLLLVAAPQIWGELARSYGACAADATRPLVDELLLAHLLEADVALRTAVARELDEEAPLVRCGAVTVGPGIRPYASLSAHPAIVRRLAGVVPAPPTQAVSLAEVIAPRQRLAELVRSLAASRARPACVVVRGRRGSGRRTIAAMLAAHTGRSIGVLEVGELDTLRSRLQAVALRGQLPCLDLDDITDDPGARARMRAIVAEHRGALFVRAPIGGDLPLAPGYDVLELGELTETERREVWRTRLGAHGLDASFASSLASRFVIGPGPIAMACAAAAAAPARDVEATLISTIRQLRAARIGSVAERIDGVASWDQLVVPEDIESALREMVARVRHRRIVLETWGLSRVAATARGITALFQGGPGTGKTMAAGVIANALGYELWRVDLSKLVSKWVGETEKNLAAVFDAAEAGEIVLLFDEADSLFSRRSDPRSGGDKHANVATNYLLQRLDTFTGIAILTTNFGTAIDPAFKRRMSVHVQFPFPDEDDRERLWRAHLPPSVPVAGDLELADIARTYQLSGGYIRNAVLRAAYLAADRDHAITAAHLRRAVLLEKERVGKLGDGPLD